MAVVGYKEAAVSASDDDSNCSFLFVNCSLKFVANTPLLLVGAGAPMTESLNRTCVCVCV